MRRYIQGCPLGNSVGGLCGVDDFVPIAALFEVWQFASPGPIAASDEEQECLALPVAGALIHVV